MKLSTTRKKICFIDLVERSNTESKEVSDGVVLEYESKRNLIGIGIDIDNVSKKLELKTLDPRKILTEIHSLST